MIPNDGKYRKSDDLLLPISPCQPTRVGSTGLAHNVDGDDAGTSSPQGRCGKREQSKEREDDLAARNPATDQEWLTALPLANGLTFFVPTDHSLAQVEYLRREIFEIETYRQSGFELRPHDTVIDVGSNMGMFTLWAAPQVAEGRVIAIEPTDAINHLRTNVDRNRLDNVVTVQAGLGRDNKERSFIYYPENSAISHHDGFRQPLATRILAKVPLFRKTQHAPIHVIAPTMSLGKIMHEYGVARVSFLKIDCEGGEYEIVRHVTPAEWRRIDRIAMEFHEFSPEHRYQILEMQLRDQGFQVEVCRPFFHYHLLRTGMIWASRYPLAPSS